ncbi:hypothetical protein L873DRAFT_1811341 [Choiromyces venosus 120613-1]|uniref:Uncharacterized protein n=1 Tax=Choiromyces venosus 120613-1 TaxID=1336337 RepID=A0A3N4JHK8_9PEZI|nr:hypothetical protein L873DRAFT_1811341 [Choiromyces venosus 120613-1]
MRAFSACLAGLILACGYCRPRFVVPGEPTVSGVELGLLGRYFPVRSQVYEGLHSLDNPHPQFLSAGYQDR